MSHVRVFFGALIGLAACDPPPPSQCQEEGRYDLLLSGQGFAFAEEGMVRFRLAAADDDFIEDSGAVEVVDGMFEWRLSCALEGSTDYRFHWYLDPPPRDASCDVGDLAWVDEIFATDRDLEIDSRPGRDVDPDACDPF